MLQQTQVATVLPYYQRFIKAFPTVQTLARAPLQKVLKLWEGLGYYARARNLHKAARRVVRDWNGRLPSEIDLLQTLPGIGRSTAGAIASLAFGRRAPILDGNLRRVFARIQAIQTPINAPSVLKHLWGFSERILPRQNVDDFNQALMDLGATLCTPKKPSCVLCPVQDFCQAFRLGIQTEIPLSQQRKPLSRRHTAVAIVVRGNQVLITKRAERGLLGGLWGFPEVPISHANDFLWIKRRMKDLWGLEVKITLALEALDHTFTHLRMTYHPFLCHYVSGIPNHTPTCRWVLPDDFANYPFSSATHGILSQLPGLVNSYSESTEPILVAAEGSPWSSADSAKTD